MLTPYHLNRYTRQNGDRIYCLPGSDTGDLLPGHVPSVTTVLRADTSYIRGDHSDAATRGNRVHAPLSRYLAGQSPDPSPSIMPYWLNLERWLARTRPTALLTESTVWTQDYAGTVDTVLSTERGIVVLDLKTKGTHGRILAKGSATKYGPHLSGYAHAFTSVYGITVSEVGVLIVYPDDRGCDEWWYNPDVGMERFEAALDTWWERNGGEYADAG